VLNAIQSSYILGGSSYTYTQLPYITTNHFDVSGRAWVHGHWAGNFLSNVCEQGTMAP
jgi:hypothetical protein